MTMTLWWTLVIIFGLVLANLWLIRRNKKLRQNSLKQKIEQKKTSDGGVTGTIAATSGTDGSRIKQVDTDHHSPSDTGSDGGSGGD